jgi:cell division protein FtsL
MMQRDFSRLLHGSWALLIFIFLMLQPAIYQGIIKASLTPSMAYLDALLAGEFVPFISQKLIWMGIFLILAFLGQLFLYFWGNKQLLGFLKREREFSPSLKRLTWAYYGLIWLMAGAILAVLLVLIIKGWQIYQLSGELGHYDVQATFEQILDKLRSLSLQSLGDMEATLKASWSILKENAPLYKVLREGIATLTQIEQVIGTSYFLHSALSIYMVLENLFFYKLRMKKPRFLLLGQNLIEEWKKD